MMNFRPARIPLPRTPVLMGVIATILSGSAISGQATIQPAAGSAPASELSDSGSATSDSSAGRKTVSLVIDYGDGFQKRFTAIPWRNGITILELMQAAKQHRRAQFDFEAQGGGATALLLKIDDVANEGGGQRNWIYYVNRVKGDRSFGIRELDVGDEVLWRFERYL